MSEHQLPLDLNDWPIDPYRLLGVRFGISPRDLKRAYLHLVRQFKPEHYPDHFRRIRQAYENLLKRSGGAHPLLRNEAETETEPENESPEPAERSRGGPAPSRKQNVPREASPDALWEQACQGKGIEAYRGLRALQERTPEVEELYARLYWLLVVLPEVEPTRSPCEWLACGLRFKPSSSLLRELYHRAIALDPAEALSPRVAGLLGLEGPSGLALDVAAWRWEAARMQSRPEVIVEDVKTLRAAGRDGDDDAWIRLLVLAASHLAWSRATHREVVTSLCVEIERLSHLHAALDFELVRLDYTLAVADGWLILKREPGTPECLTELLARSWDRPVFEVRPLLTKFLALVAHLPARSLSYFDRIQAIAPAVLGHLAELFDAFGTDAAFVPDSRSSSALAKPILAFLATSTWWEYRLFRPQLLSFCLREAISPAAISAVVVGHPNFAIGPDQHLADSVAADWPLRHVYSACELFWG